MQRIFKISICLVCILLIWGFLFNKNNQEVTKNSVENNICNNNMLSMMLETSAGSGVYKSTELNDYPTTGYIFNAEKSKCENGGSVIWDDTIKKVKMVGNISDKCYVYFDKYNAINITKITSSNVTAIGFTINLSATLGDNGLSSYYYSVDGGRSFVSSTSNSYTFRGLTKKTTYSVVAYATDNKNRKSNEVFLKVTTSDEMTLVNYVKSLYTGTQGANGIYYHNSGLANGAKDSSYRYTGANPNNYVCFDNTCSYENMYRIIGVFNNRIKLIKADFASREQLGTVSAISRFDLTKHTISSYKGKLTIIDTYYWSYTNSTSSTNVWSDSNTNKEDLNGTFLTNMGTTWSNKIDNTTWLLGGNTYALLMTNKMSDSYLNEITSPAENVTYDAKVGLMYVSDYAFGANPSYWTKDGYNSTGADYDYRSAISENWMCSGFAEWTITKRSDHEQRVFMIGYEGHVGSFPAGSLDEYIGLRPVFYLKSSINYVSGVGSLTDPIIIN